ncbi:Non-specific serine/threonine protein kinase protein [Dioscorea alata]|uniref:Non-specific serine/threonine protein kinase protein n=6 Tax=Dioscorea alata TaxID=55571 RepID=A0ACB7VGZ2_DIOAL|nr:Non-specific serine/threonine protein kinase protein [Dioscorea alata]KAH7672945.1 Non-specific serine/threonine protein kinase protein [Dioscorea alata]KAH7672946.1 Non-specific serine/threonine protein kinase protein [Dioscorea alata]KAH7672949.1 Non-specific serine/threonine protein kinase protein [Dioscorea alata]KAH7672950.1 Non-specific serine/threonine protein kinase protein [Dioscorea alata]
MAASLIICRYFSFLLAIFSFFFVSECYPRVPSFSFSFSIGRFHESNFSTNSEISLSGNTHVTSDGSSIQMTGARIMYSKPIKFQGQKPAFSTNFTFSFPSPSHNLVFFVTPYTFPSPSHVPDGSRDGGNGDALFLLTALTITFQMVPLESKSQYHVQIVVASQAYTESTNFSYVNLVLDDVGEKLQSWIDYDGDFKRVRVWVAKSGELRPLNSSVSSCPIDLSEMLQRDIMYVGIDNNINSSSGGFALPTCLYSWSFTSINGAPYMMHSEPLNPQSMLVRSKDGNGNGTFIQLRGTSGSALGGCCAFH